VPLIVDLEGAMDLLNGAPAAGHQCGIGRPQDHCRAYSPLQCAEGRSCGRLSTCPPREDPLSIIAAVPGMMNPDGPIYNNATNCVRRRTGDPEAARRPRARPARDAAKKTSGTRAAGGAPALSGISAVIADARTAFISFRRSGLSGAPTLRGNWARPPQPSRRTSAVPHRSWGVGPRRCARRAGVAGLLEFSRASFEAGHEIEIQAKVLGVTVEQLQGLPEGSGGSRGRRRPALHCAIQARPRMLAKSMKSSVRT